MSEQLDQLDPGKMATIFEDLPHLSAVIELHNVQLEGVREVDGATVMVVSRNGDRGEMPACAGCSKWLLPEVGKFGALVPAPTSERSWTFRAYVDQSLRRAPELDGPSDDDSPGRIPNVIGWRCKGRSRGFRAPVGLVPGSGGAFVPDTTEEVRLRAPQEFILLCKQFGLRPDEMLNAFMADACDLSSTNALPRADGFQRSGSDEADLAQAWIERAFRDRLMEGPVATVDQAHGDRVEEFDELLAEFQWLGGDPDGLLDLVRSQLMARRHEADRQ